MTARRVGGGVAWLNALPRAELVEELLACCGASHWVERMITRRPWATAEGVLHSSDEVGRSLVRDDWLEAFGHHPRLGESQSHVPQGKRASGWSAAEQSALGDARAELRTALAAANAAYEKKFGYICIICATGRDPDELLAITRARLGNTPAIELRIAAEEQRKITRLRLQKLLGEAPEGCE